VYQIQKNIHFVQSCLELEVHAHTRHYITNSSDIYWRKYGVKHTLFLESLMEPADVLRGKDTSWHRHWMHFQCLNAPTAVFGVLYVQRVQLVHFWTFNKSCSGWCTTYPVAGSKALNV